MATTTKRLLLCAIATVLLTSCKPTLSPEEKAQLGALQSERVAVQAEIATASRDDAKYAGGLIKSLIAVRLEVLKTTDALLQQRIHALEGNATTETVVKQSASDPVRAKALTAEIGVQQAKLAESRAQSDRYSGGLVKALAETTVATASNTLALLEQERLKAEYGLVLPDTPPATGTKSTTSADTRPTPGASPPIPSAAECLKIETFDSSVLSSNNTFTEVAWKADVSNSCAEPFDVRVVFKLYDKDEFELDSDSESLHVASSSTGKARGKMLVSPPEKARRMARQGVSLSR